MGPNPILTQEEEQKLCDYIDDMLKWTHSMTLNQLKTKVVEITQRRVIPFKDGMPYVS